MKNLFFFIALSFAFNNAFAAVSLRFDSVKIIQLAKVIFTDYLSLPYIIEDGVGDKVVSLNLEGVKKEKVAEVLSRGLSGVGVRVVFINGVVYLTSSPQKDEIFYYRLRYRDKADVLDLLSSAFPGVANASNTSLPIGFRDDLEKSDTAVPGSTDKQEVPGAAAVFRKSVPTADSDVLVLRVSPGDKEAIKDLVTLIDQPYEQVQVKALAYDVSLDTAAGSALDVAVNVLGDKFKLHVSGGALTGASSLSFESGTVQAVAKLLDKDSRFKTVARPSVRVRSGQSARFQVGQEVPTLSGVTSNATSTSQSVSYRQAGVIFDVSPVVRSGGIYLHLKQTVSDFRRTDTSALDTPTLNKRELETHLTLESGQMIVVAGLDSDVQEGGDSRFFGFSVGGSATGKKRQTLIFIEVTRI